MRASARTDVGTPMRNGIAAAATSVRSALGVAALLVPRVAVVSATVSNVMETKHDTAKASISNVR